MQNAVATSWPSKSQRAIHALEKRAAFSAECDLLYHHQQSGLSWTPAISQPSLTRGMSALSGVVDREVYSWSPVQDRIMIPQRNQKVRVQKHHSALFCFASAHLLIPHAAGSESWRVGLGLPCQHIHSQCCRAHMQTRRQSSPACPGTGKSDCWLPCQAAQAPSLSRRTCG